MKICPHLLKLITCHEREREIIVKHTGITKSTACIYCCIYDTFILLHKREKGLRVLLVTPESNS